MAKKKRAKGTAATGKSHSSTILQDAIRQFKIPPDCLSYNLHYDPFLGMDGDPSPPDVQACAEVIQADWRATRARFHTWATSRGMNGDERDRLERSLWAAQPARTDGTEAGEQL